MRKTIAIDMDGVLADTDTHFLNWYYNHYGVRVPYEELIGKPEGEGFPEKDAVHKFVLTPGFFRTLPVMDGSIEVVAELMKRYDVYIVSAAMQFPQSLSEKHEWLNENFPFIPWTNIVFCGNKSLIKADYMIDDHCKNLDGFEGNAILFNAAHNVYVTHHQRASCWNEVKKIILHC